jgi:hypothetical protein
MKALILRNNTDAAIGTARALVDKGFQVLCVETLAVAHALIRVDTIDLLVMDERVEGQLTHSIALSGERRNPYLSAILLTDRIGEEMDDLYELIPSLYALVGADTAPGLLGKLSISAVSNKEQVNQRVAENAAIDLAEAQQPEDSRIAAFESGRFANTDDDAEGGAPSYADAAIAIPALAEIAARKNATLENVEDAVMAEVAAIFRNNPLPHLAEVNNFADARAS